jgi:hypothetical protein
MHANILGSLSMESSKSLYSDAYDLHYKKKNFAEALVMYRLLLELYPESQEAAYATSLISNIEEIYTRDGITGDGPIYRDGLANKYLEIQKSIEEKLAEVILLSDSLLEKWEYQQLHDASDERLNALGAKGWELVGISSFKVGGGLTLNGFGGSKYTVHIHYAMKRRLAQPQNIDSTLNQIQSIQNEILELRKEVAQMYDA